MAGALRHLDAMATRVGGRLPWRWRAVDEHGTTLDVLLTVRTGACEADVTPARLRVALAAYVRSLARTESRVDFAFRGDTAALTAPYMHSGVFPTLAAVVAFYDGGGGVGRGVRIGNQTLSPEPLRLSRSDRAALLAFLRALTDTAFTR